MKKILLFFALFLFEKTVAQQRGTYFDDAQKKYGLADPETGEPMTAPIFENAFFMEGTDSLVYAKTTTGFGIFSMTGRVVLAPKFYSIYHNRTGAGASGFADVTLNDLTGLARLSDGKIVLPPEFKVVGAFSPTRVFGRRDGSKMIEVFDQNGQKTVEFEGKVAYFRGQDDFVHVLKNDDSMAQLHVSGADFSTGVTAGSAKIFQTLDKNGAYETAFLLNEWGDTVHRNATEIHEIAYNRFLIGFKNKPFWRWGLCDETGKWLIEPTEKTFKTLGERLSLSGVLVATDGKGNVQIYRKNGQILIDSCRIDSILVDREVTRRAKNSVADRFFTVEKIGRKGSLGLFKFNGEMVLPMEFSSIVCATNEHPIIAAKPRPEGGFLCGTFDLETGQKLFDDDLVQLLFTPDPNVFWAKKMDGWALVNPFSKSSEPPKFDVAYVIQHSKGCFEIYEKGSRKMVDPTGRKVLARDLDGVRSPTERQFEQFFERTGRRGQLVAVEIRRRDPEGAWHSISLGGDRLFFESEKRIEKVKIADSDAIVEAEMTDAAIVVKMPPPISERPSIEAPDEVLTMVEKMPKFTGGDAALLTFLKQNLQFPTLAKENGIQGHVVLQFIVEKDGSLTDPKIVRDIGGDCGKEALRLVGLMPKWTAGEQNGRFVRVKYSMLVSFKLD